MKKTLIAATSAFALVLGLSGAASANSDRPDQTAVAVSVQLLGQQTANINAGNPAQMSILPFIGGQANGEHTFTHQVLNVNNFAQGVNSAQQGAISLAVAANFSGS